MSGAAAVAASPAPRRILIAGNPNCGKSTLFNALSGARVRVGNYPGVTVERKTAGVTLPDGSPAEIVDLPGTYSLSARSPEEEVAVDAVLGRGQTLPDAVVVVVDATTLARGLYLTCQVLETGAPTLVALNMMDEARAQGLEIDVPRLEACLGAQVVPLVASKGEGLDRLREAMASLAVSPPEEGFEGPSFREALKRDQERIEAHLPPEVATMSARARDAWARWALLSVEADDELRGIPEGLRREVLSVRNDARAEGRDIDREIIEARYRWVDEVRAQAVKDAPAERLSWTDRVDRALTHPVWGLLVFLGVMLLIFETLFTWAEPFMGWVEAGIAWAQEVTVTALPPGPFTDLLADGVIAGVGNVVVFVPQIALLFLFITFLEDVGYLARVAFVIDRVMSSVGLHGKAFVPLLSGFACAIPAVMATRTIESRRDRLITMLALPLMSCSARLPVYVLVVGTVFATQETIGGFLSVGAVAMLAMYLLSVAATLTAAAVLRRTVLKGPKPSFFLELPPYRRPVAGTVLRAVWDRVRSFLVDAGTIILALSILMWGLLSYPKDPEVEARFEEARIEARADLRGEALEERLTALDAREQASIMEQSFAGRLGKLLEPALEPLGFDWRLGVGIVGAFAAREVFVSTLGIVFGIGDTDEESRPLRQALKEAEGRDGGSLMTPLVGVSLMVFFVLACQCMSTIAVVRRESGSWKWPLLMFAYMTVLAYMASLAVYQIGSLFGWGTA